MVDVVDGEEAEKLSSCQTPIIDHLEMSETMSLPRKPSEKKVSEEEGNGKALEYLAGVKVHILKDDNQDPSDLTATTYVLEKEDHTLGNAIRWMVMKE